MAADPGALFRKHLLKKGKWLDLKAAEVIISRESYFLKSVFLYILNIQESHSLNSNDGKLQ